VLVLALIPQLRNSASSLGLGPYAYNAPLTGASITVTNFQRRLILEPAGTIATLTVVLPPVGAAGTLLSR
jgi:hypothetical protein